MVVRPIRLTIDVDAAPEGPKALSEELRLLFVGRAEERKGLPVLLAAFQALVDALAALQRDGVVRDDDTVLMARHVWAVVHGVAMLGIDGQLREPGNPGSGDALTRYSLERLRTGIGGKRR